MNPFRQLKKWDIVNLVLLSLLIIVPFVLDDQSNERAQQPKFLVKTKQLPITSNGFTGGYEWLTADSLLTAKRVNGKLEPIIIDSMSGKMNRLKKISDDLAEAQISGFSWRLSFDRRMLLLCSETRGQHYYRIFDLLTDATHVVDRPSHESMNNFLPNSDGLIERFRSNRCSYIALKKPFEATRAVLPLPDNIGSYLGERDGKLLFLGVLESDKVSSVELFELAIDREVRITNRYRISLPEKSMVMQVSLSPNGDALLWTAEIRKRLPQVQLVRSFPFIRVHRDLRTKLWSMTLIDKKFVLFADVPNNDLWSARWLPTGNELSFIFKGILHTAETN